MSGLVNSNWIIHYKIKKNKKTNQDKIGKITDFVFARVVI